MMEQSRKAAPAPDRKKSETLLGYGSTDWVCYHKTAVWVLADPTERPPVHNATLLLRKRKSPDLFVTGSRDKQQCAPCVLEEQGESSRAVGVLSPRCPGTHTHTHGDRQTQGPGGSRLCGGLELGGKTCAGKEQVIRVQGGTSEVPHCPSWVGHILYISENRERDQIWSPNEESPPHSQSWP